MEQFASGRKRNYYGKADVIAYRLCRAKFDGHAVHGKDEFFGANFKLLLYGDAFWPTYTTGDNTGLIATDSMKNFIQREVLNYAGSDLEGCCHFLGAKFIELYPQVEGLQISAVEIPYANVIGASDTFTPAGPERATARIELNRKGTVELTSGIVGFRLLRLGGSAFYGFVRDQYTTLPDVKDRPLHMWLDLEWRYTDEADAFSEGAIGAVVNRIVRQVFFSFESGSIQQIIYQIGAKVLDQFPSIAEVELEANNRTWDMVAPGEGGNVFTDARPPYGCLGLKLRR